MKHHKSRLAGLSPARDILFTEIMMQTMWRHAAAMAAIFAVPYMAAAQAQSAPPQAQNPPAAKTQAGPTVAPFDFSGSFFRTFSNSTTGNGTMQSPVDSYGGMVGGRFIPAPWKGLEIDYSYSRLNSTYTVQKGSCGFQCLNPTVTIPNNQSQVTVNYVVSRRMGSLTPFAEAGFAFVIASATGNDYAINTVVRPGYVATAGTDFGGPRFGLRVQFRDTLYKAPNLTFAYQPTGKFMQTATPMVGFYFRPW
ncbi:MAG TPA: hypothetical protein VMU71_01915 [Terracidiphilus sp.]|nr:hypothetical protein [Terracidiphilus sp.]